MRLDRRFLPVCSPQFEFLIVSQTKLHTDFGYDDDFVIQTLEKCMDELRKANLDLPPPASEIELPKKQFGVFVEPTVEAKVGSVAMRGG